MQIEPYDESLKERGDWNFRLQARRIIVNWWYAHTKMQGTPDLFARAWMVHHLFVRPDPYPGGPNKISKYVLQQLGDTIELGKTTFTTRTILDMAITDIRQGQTSSKERK